MEPAEQPLMVIGHKNPDTDSICSAIAYAHYKREVAGVPAIPYRAGNVNPQTSFVLEHFGVPQPELRTTILPRLSDIMIQGENLLVLSEHDPLGDAQEIITRRRFAFLPVTGENGQYAGKISALRLAGLLEDIGEPFRNRSVTLRLDRLIRSIGGAVVRGSGPDVFRGRVWLRGLTEEPPATGEPRLVVLPDGGEGGLAGAMERGVEEIIDHHRLGFRGTDLPITFINKVVGCTSTIIAELCRHARHTPPPEIAGLMLSAILSDTVILQSPTTTDLDREMARWLADIARVEIDGFGARMFAAGCAVEGMDPRAIIRQDLKAYEENGWKLSVSQMETVGFDAFKAMSGALATELETARVEAECHLGCLMVTDITSSTSLLLCTGEEKIIDAITYPRVGENLFEMSGVLSRKKQMMPY